MKRRLIAFGVAAVPMLALVAARATLGYCYPGCSIWSDSNPEWYLFLCYLCGYAP